MQLSGAPAKIVEAFAINGNKRTIPVPSQASVTPGAASYNDGFPPLNGTPVSAGGIPPSILDMNGILNGMSAVDVFMSAGGHFQYDSVFSAAIGGYPKGARLLNGAGTGYWSSTTDNNVTDPDTGGAGWVPDRATAGVYASAQQSLATGAAKILWDTVEWDALGLWNASAKAFQAIWAGRYRLSGSVYLPAPSGQLFATSVYKNNVIARNGSQYPQVSDGDMSFLFDGVVSCAAGDQLSAYLNVTGAPVTAGNTSNNSAFVYGQVEYLGA
jgi:hypothetical protein